MKLNLGSGDKKKEGFINIDIRGGDIQRDVLRGLPFQDNTIDEIESEYFMEHIPQIEVIWLMNEIWRVLKPEGIMTHLIPLANMPDDLADPTHLSKWTLGTFNYFEKGNRKNEYYGDAIKSWTINYLELIGDNRDTIKVILKK